MEQRDLEVMTKIQIIINNLEEIDKMIESQSEELRAVDFEISDILHLIQESKEENLNTKACVNIINRLRELRLRRKYLNNEYEIENAFKQSKNMLPHNGTRKSFAQTIARTVERLNQPYNNRIMTEEMVESLIGKPKEQEVVVEKKKRGRPRKVVDNDLEKLEKFNEELLGN